jgi:hypothetical protein
MDMSGTRFTFEVRGTKWVIMSWVFIIEVSNARISLNNNMSTSYL